MTWEWVVLILGIWVGIIILAIVIAVNEHERKRWDR